MRIVMTTDAVGGVWTFTQELCAGLLEQACDIALVSLGDLPGAGQRHWISNMEKMWGRHFVFTALNTHLEWMQENEDSLDGAAQELMKIAADFDADLFHFNQFCFGALRTDLPKVVTAHSDVLSWAKSCRDGGMEESRWLTQYRSLVSSGLAHADVVTAPSRWMLVELAESFALPAKQFVIPNGRNISSRPNPDRKMQAVTAGRLWDAAKNVALLGEVLSEVPLLVAGESSCHHGEVPLLCGPSLLGLLAEEDLFSLFGESALYICTSRYEPFGLAPLEAALCGCAILANDIPSLHEVWGDGALYFDNACSLSAMLTRLHHNRDALMAAQARSHARASLYTRERMTAAYMNVFSHAVKLKDKNAVAYVA
jgi:glycogen(starch) synthase